MEGTHSFIGIWAKDTVNSYFGDEWIGIGYDIELVLHLPYLFPGAAYLKIVPWPGGWNAGYDFRGVDEHGIPIIVPQDFNGSVTFVSQGLTSPLAQL